MLDATYRKEHHHAAEYYYGIWLVANLEEILGQFQV